MSNVYWYGGSGSWSDYTNHWSNNSGNSPASPHGSAPGTDDDVIIDSNSGTGTITIDVAATCASFNSSTGTITGLAFSNTLTIYGSATFNSTISPSGTSATYFKGTGSHTITAAGVLANKYIYIGDNGTNPTYTLQDTLSCTGIYHVSGTINTGSNTVNSSLSTSGTTSNTRGLVLGSTVWTGANFGYSTGDATLTVDAGESSIVMNQNNSFSGAGKTWYDLTLANSSTYSGVSGANSFHNLTISGTSSAKLWYCYISNDQTVTGTFTVNGTSLTRRVLIKSSLSGTVRTITAANVSLSNCDFEDITGAGAGTWSGSSVGNGGNNSGITFTTPVTRYWVQNGGSWSDTAHWDADSGGAGGDSVPLCHDTVIFNSSSISSSSQTITLDVGSVPNLNFSGVTNSPTVSWSSAIWTFGEINFTGVGALSNASNYETQMHGRSTSYDITTNGLTIYTLRGYHYNSTITAQDNITLTSVLNNYSGTFDLNDKNLICSGFSPSSETTTYLGSGTITLNGTGTVLAPAGNFYCETSTVQITNTSATSKTLGNSATYYNLEISGDNVSITGNNTITTLAVNTAGLTTGLKFSSGTTQTVTNFTTNGSDGNLAKILSASAGSHFHLTTSSSYIEVDYMSITDSYAMQSNTWYAGNHSYEGTGNTNWIFTDKPETYSNSALANIVISSVAYTKDNSSKAGIKSTITNNNSAKADIKVTTTQIESAKASIKTTPTKNNSSKADVKRSNETRNNSAKAWLLIRQTQNNRSKGDIKTTYTKNNSSLASIVRTGDKPLSSKANIKRIGETQVNSAKAWLLIRSTKDNRVKGDIKRSNETQNNNAKSSIRRTETYNLSSKADIKSTLTNNNSAKSDILVIKTQNNNSKADIKATLTHTNNSKSSLVRTEAFESESKADIKSTYSKNNSAIGTIVVTNNYPQYVKSDILRTNETQINSVKSLIEIENITNSNRTKASIVRTESYTNRTKADVIVENYHEQSIKSDILKTISNSNRTIADILNIYSVVNNSKASIVRTEDYETSSKSDILAILENDNSATGDVLRTDEKRNCYAKASIYTTPTFNNYAKTNMDDLYQNWVRARITVGGWEIYKTSNIPYSKSNKIYTSRV